VKSQINILLCTVPTSDRVLQVSPLNDELQKADGFVILPHRSGNLGFAGLTAEIVPKSTVLH
jgi:hypothetical protein